VGLVQTKKIIQIIMPDTAMLENMNNKVVEIIASIKEKGSFDVNIEIQANVFLKSLYGF